MYGETLAIEDCYSDLDENEDGSHGQNGEATEKKWAQLIPLNPLLTKTVLLEPVEKYSFGKGEDCDCILPADAFSSASLAVISKKHFIIHKQLCSADMDDFDVVLQDISSNGTLVNGNKVGKNKFHVLQSNDEISLATNSIKVFMFVSAKSTSSSVHSDVADKYLVSKQLGK
ncbi:ovarian-specific serine/threonine-protein kinase Lok-like [Symsagittifera roscoffensis]|uniref:ovarian-specific serine/threonine-protein kinase Lok-like n=1 Tax=Symsagittifera roscoffensis TaxID=84072 RepID=UPI00307C62AB